MDSSFKVRYIDLPKQYDSEKKDLEKIILEIAKSGQFILRDEVQKFENETAKYLKSKYCIGVNSGTDAIFLGLKASGIQEGDEIITVSHTFIATISSIIHCGAKPVLVDIKDDGNIDPHKIEAAITFRTKAIVVVHMNGKICDMEQIVQIAQKYNLDIFEDAAQAFGATYKGKFGGTFGKFGAFSFHPMKVLGCMGDGGLIATNDKEVYEKLLLLRNHGQKTKSNITIFGYNSRLDNLQAAILLYRLSNLESTLEERRKVAKRYIKNLSTIEQIKLPEYDENNRRDVFSSFVIIAQNRDNLKKHLLQKGIEVAVHWEIPNHKQANLNLDHYDLSKTEEYSKNILSLPIHPCLNINELEYVVKTIREFYEN